MRKDGDIGGANTRDTACLAQRKRLVSVQTLAAFDTDGGHLHKIHIGRKLDGFHLLLLYDFPFLAVEESGIEFLVASAWPPGARISFACSGVADSSTMRVRAASIKPQRRFQSS